MTDNYLFIAAATSEKPCGEVLLRSQCRTDNFRLTWSNFDSALAPKSPAWLPLSAHYTQHTGQCSVNLTLSLPKQLKLD